MRIFISLLIKFYYTCRRRHFVGCFYFLVCVTVYNFKAYPYFIFYAGHRMRLMIVPFIFVLCFYIVFCGLVSLQEITHDVTRVYRKVKKRRSGYRISYCIQPTRTILYITSTCMKRIFMMREIPVLFIYSTHSLLYLCLSYTSFMYKWRLPLKEELNEALLLFCVRLFSKLYIDNSCA